MSAPPVKTLPKPAGTKLFSKDGVEMMEIKSIDQEGDRLVIKGKMMGAMATTIYVNPQDVWGAFLLFPMRVKLRMPLLLYKGWKLSKAAKKT